MQNRWILMCPNKEEARKNRERIADKSLNRRFWDELERTLAATPTEAPLPSSVSIGTLPYAGKRKESHFNQEEVMDYTT